MIEIDWEKFMRITPGSLSEEEKDEIYEAIVWFNPNDSLDRQYLIQFIHVSQEILKFKFRQVKTLTNKLDEVTSKSEKETSSKLQNYVDEIKLLRDELDYYKKVGRNNESFASSSNEDLKRELLKSQVQAKELFKELKEKEKDLMHERKEVERYASQVATLEIKEQEVKRELKALQEEIVQKTSESLQGSPESGVEKQGVCTEIIREKNKHIQQLLEDIEVMENENISLRSKISSIKDELSETISHMVEITAELSKLRHLNKEYVSREADFKDKINSLMFQIEELVEEKTKINNKFDEYVLMFNEKVQEWKEVLDLKDNEIIKLKNEIKDLYSSTNAISASEAADAQLNKKLIQQQEQIEILQLELQNATEDIRSSSELIEKLKEKQIHLLSGPLHSQSSTILLEEKIKVLEEKLIYAEEDAHVKAEEMSDLVIQLREYESNVFGLPEAVEKIKKLEKTIEKKDFQAERLIEICNNLEMKLDNLEQQNLALRDRLGLSISDEIDTSGVVLKYKKDEELMQNLKCQLNRKEEELIKVKLKCRKLMTSAKMFPSKAIMQCPVKFENKKLQTDTSQLDEKLPVKLELILKENDALRKGMHEILESIREQNCLGTVEVQSTSLKRLLEALDSRHVSGWYHPAMRLQAQLCSEEGKNDELRNQIRSMRAEEKKKASELQNAYLKIQSLENDFSNSRLEEEKEAQSENSSSTGEGRNSPVAYLAHTVLERKVIELESRLHESKMMCDSKVANFEEKEKLFMAEKEMLLVKLEELECQVNMFKNQNQHSNFKEFCELTSQITVLNRKVNYLTNLESSNNQNYRKLKQEFIDQEEKMLQDILKLQNQKLELLYKIENLEKTVLNAVPVEKFVSVSNELATIQAKYKCAISLVLVEESDNNENLKTEISLLQSEKQFLLDELKIAKEKLIVAEALISEEAVTKGDFSNEISAFARNLAASETRELNEKQKCTHLEKINNALLLQQSEFEGRNKELLEKVEKLTEENFKLKEVERNLREKVLNHFAGEERNVLEAKVEKLEEKVLKLSAEKENIQELFEISQGQCRAYQEWKDADQILLSSQNEQILLLQASNDNAASISRLSHELTMSKLLTSELTKKNNDLKIQLTKLLAENLNLEGKILEHRNEFFKTKKKHLTHVGYLYQTISEIRTIYGCSVVFRDLEEVYNMKLDLKKEKKKLVGKMSSLKTESQEYLLKKAEMEAQLEGLEDLKTALKSDAKNLITWHNKSTELRIKEAKYRRENDFLIEEVSQLRNRVKKLNEELILLEQKNIEREKEWEGKQLLWEENQFKMSMLLQKQGTEENFKIFCDASTFTDNITENIGNDSLERESVLAQEENAPLMNEGVAELKESQRKEENIGTAEDKEFCDINNTSKILDFEQRTCQRKIDSKEKEAFRVTIGSLQSIIKQKEETILRYQDLLKRGREEHGKAYSKLQEELKTLNGALAVQSRAYNKLKNAVQMNHFSGDNVPLIVEKYVTTIQELEEELRECQLNLSSVNTQAFANKQEVEKWKNLATERLLQLEDSRRR